MGATFQSFYIKRENAAKKSITPQDKCFTWISGQIIIYTCVFGIISFTGTSGNRLFYDTASG
ncbi:hypothetical protein AQPE_0384 [Aquipluma nitroreducens]|uniref:Uncharacterized protein n=1 Tax=Aquipluma nitroreducens TaxID=2010828 RepID=A0A5K7S417_9BACT|nr:hypothetical protein AQPE_0384 [Aquipluma nitroreducens]